MEEKDIISMLDNMCDAGVSRIKLETSGEMEEGEIKKKSHHGRCDVGSPFATGKLYNFDSNDCN